MKLKVINLNHHRNGICGAPFDVVLFEDQGPEGSRKVAILFEQEHHCAVLDVNKLAAGDIAFGSNSWRGDQYEPHLRKAIDQHLNAQRDGATSMTHADNTLAASKHTPEPWWLDDDGFIAAGSGDTYCTVVDPHCRPTDNYSEENEANARRIVAAVNACQGISTKALEQGVIGQLVEALDYLLQQTVDMDLKYGIDLTEGEQDARAKALSAIAKATTLIHQSERSHNHE
jgi:hypothetical protein